ncbi:carbohydrate-binding family 9-like protein [Mucilaginibacter sp. RS28]|uniref:Carbohydrate-binding family 9-like protein n=1 Tax=Mucilaginibacter straminoryzae TaxID=2932774 RepID=A0A9X1X5P2_9SPHI|nr:carbohydrate-binding family 9-like protein [Mucilaginibacter straminoryzae]MCJ8210073.1 carbohydrate-binding family 9-like protein [Mucilaginibacter straminoryzae]
MNNYPNQKLVKLLFSTVLLLSFQGAFAQDLFKGFEELFTSPLNYMVGYTSLAPKIDGDINDAVWQKASWTAEFQDIEGNTQPKPSYPTRVKMLWDDHYLYIAAELKDPQVWASIKQHDAIVYWDNDFEVFIDPANTSHRYFEIEINPLNTIFDLFLNKPYRNGGTPLISWDTPGLRSAVQIQGTLNKSNDTDRGWTVEMAIPFKALGIGDNERNGVTEGTLWRINFSRVEWDTKVVNGKYVKVIDSTKSHPEHNWVWSPQAVINMHFPERWGYLQFTKQQTPPAFQLPYEEEQRKYLWLLYYKQKQYQEAHHRYATTLAELNFPETINVGSSDNKVNLEATPNLFMATISTIGAATVVAINQEGLIQKIGSSKR